MGLTHVRYFKSAYCSSLSGHVGDGGMRGALQHAHVGDDGPAVRGHDLIPYGGMVRRPLVITLKMSPSANCTTRSSVRLAGCQCGACAGTMPWPMPVWSWHGEQ